MTEKNINHPIIASYVNSFINDNEIANDIAKDKHLIFEMFMNSLILDAYTNDTTASYQDMETGTAIGIDGLAIFVADKLVANTEDVDSVISSMKKFDVSFYFTQTKTTESFNRQDMLDFFNAVIKFFSFDRDKCLIPELNEFWEIAKYIYDQASKFKSLPKINLIYTTLAAQQPAFDSDIHLSSDLNLSKQNIEKLALFDEEISIEFFGLHQIMALEKKTKSRREIVISMPKAPISYPKHNDNQIENAYFGLLKIDQLMKMISEEINHKRILRKGVFDDNIRFYLGSSDKVDVNVGIKEQLLGTEYHLFGILNNGITVICDEAKLNSEELSLVNYQIVNGCQTSNVIFEHYESLGNKQDIFIPVKFIATEDEETKNAIIRGTNSQTSLTPAQLMALSNIQKTLEEFYNTQMNMNNFPLYYERRTEQYRDDDIQKTKIINIPTQIKCVAAQWLNLPHEVSGQYGKVEKATRGKIFNETHLSFLSTYYISGLCWYRVERFVQNNEEGRKFKRARWHIMMLFKLLNCNSTQYKDNSSVSPSPNINKKMNQLSKTLEKKLLISDDHLNQDFIKILNFIKITISTHYPKRNADELFADRKLFERKETTTILIEAAKNKSISDIA